MLVFELTDRVDALMAPIMLAAAGAVYVARRLEPRSLDRTAIRVGAAADGATIKEGSYLVIDNHLVQIIDGAPRPVTIRHGKGTEGIPAKHVRLIRGLIAVRDATRAILRAQEADEPWGPAQTRLRAAYASFVRAAAAAHFLECVHRIGESLELGIADQKVAILMAVGPAALKNQWVSTSRSSSRDEL